MPLLASYVFLNFLKKERLIPLVVQILVVHDLFRASDKKHAIGHECLIELLINLILGFFRKNRSRHSCRRSDDIHSDTDPSGDYVP